MRTKVATKPKAMRLLSLFLVFVMLITTQGFTSIAKTVSENEAMETNGDKADPGQLESQSVEAEENTDNVNAKEDNLAQNWNTELENAGDVSETLSQSDSVSENSVKTGAGTPANPVHNCTKQNDGTDTTTWSYVYFGSYPQSEVTDITIISAIDSAILAGSGTTADAGTDVWVNGTKYRRISKSDTNYDGYFDEVTNNGYRYFKWERIKWRVLDNNGSTLFVVADGALDCKDYNDVYTSITWENSTIRSWLNDSFYHTAFSSNEQNAIVAQNVVNDDNPNYGTEGENNTTDKVYLLSIDEVTNATYGFCSDYGTYSASRWMQPSNYARARGTYTYSGSFTGNNDNCWCWLRSPGTPGSNAAIVHGDGDVDRYGRDVSTRYFAVLPALHINLSSGIWSMTDDGTSGDGGEGGGSTNIVQCPEASIPGGSYTTAQRVTLQTTTSGAEIYYTIDGSTPSKNNGTKYIGAITISNTLTLKAIAVKEGMADSSVMLQTYVFPSQEITSVTLPQIALGEKQSGSVKDKEVLRFFPGDFELQSTFIPVSASKSTDSDGSYKLNIAIGVGGADWLDNSSEWNRFKENVDDLQSGVNKHARMSSLQKAFGGTVVAPASVSGFNKTPEVSVVGYYELEIDKNGNIVKNTGMFQMDAGWQASIGWQFATPIGPMYLCLEGSGKITGELGVSYAIENNDFLKGKWNMEGGVTLTPGISLEGGYGVAKVATIGAKGSAEVPIQIIPASKGDFEAKASVHVYVIFVLDATWDLATYTKPLWDTTKNKAGAQSGSAEDPLSNVEINPTNLKPVDVSYTEHTTSWQGNTAETANSPKSLAAKAGTDENQQTAHVLQSGIMPNTLPLMKEIGDDTVMVFQATDAERATLDSSALMYSVYHDNTWSKPTAVWDNGTCDMYADLQKVGEDLYLVWQKENATITANGEDGEEALSEMAEKSEICFAKYNETTMQFEEISYITEDAKVDMMPKLAQNGDNVAAVWVTNTDNSFLQETGTNQIVYTTLDLETNSFGSETVLCETQSGIEEIAPYYENGVLHVGYISEANSENSTNQVFLAKEGTESREISDGTTLTSNIQYTNGTLYYYQEGVMKAYDMTASTLTSITAGESPVGGNGKVYKNNGKTAVIWSKPDQATGTSSVYSSVKTEEGFSEPVELYNTTSSINYLDGVLKTDGTWQFIMNTVAPDSEENIHSLIYVTREGAPEIEVVSITVDDAAKENVGTPISYMVTNTSEETINNLNVNITDGNGFSKQVTIPVSIAPGETVYDTVNVDLSEVTDTTTASITILADGQTDSGNNTVEVAIAQTDLTLETIMTETEEDVCIVASVSNNSIIPADATVTLYGNVEQTETLETVSLGEISQEEGGSYTFYLKKSDLTMNENLAAYLPVVVTSDKEDSNEDNNTEIEIAYATLDDSDVPGNNEDDGKKEDNPPSDNGNTNESGNNNGGNNQNGNGSTNNNTGEKPSPVKVQKLSITAPSKKLAAGKKVKLTLTVTPSNAANKAVTWKSSNTKYATVDKNGRITLKKAGAGKTVTITATAKDGSGKKATIKIKIMKHAVKSIKITAPSKTLKAGKSMKLKTTIKTTGKSVNKTLKWTSSNKKYATVNSKGKVTAKKAGKGKTVTITATATDGSNKKAKVKIKIK